MLFQTGDVVAERQLAGVARDFPQLGQFLSDPSELLVIGAGFAVGWAQQKLDDLRNIFFPHGLANGGPRDARGATVVAKI